MNVSIMKEAGYEEALFGLGLNKGITSKFGVYSDLPEETKEKLKQVASKLGTKDGGHNKFIESIQLWIDVKAPIYWWGQADTYRMSTKQSESVMHTFEKELFESTNAESFFINKCEKAIDQILSNRIYCIARAGHFDEARALIPQGWLQRRIWCMNYKTLRNIYLQRKDHRLKHWRYFCEYVYANCEHPEFLNKGE